MFTWYRELSTKERTTFWSCFGGWALDAMDAQMFSFLIPVLIAVWGISKTQAGYLGTTALIATAVGGWISGLLADRFGRVRVLQITICWFAFFTFLAGCTQGYGQMLVVRALQGFGFGGEWGAGAVLMGEIIRPQHRGKAVGCVQSGYGVGWTVATLLSTAGFLLLPHSIAWRALLWIGALPALLVLFIRRNIDEPEVFKQTRRAERASGEQPGLFAIFRPEILRTTILASLLALGVIGAGSAIVPWLPTYMRNGLKFSVSATGVYMVVVTVGSFFGFVGSAYLSDIVGRRRNFLIFAACSWLVTLGYMYLPLGNAILLVLSFPFGFFTVGAYSSLGPFFTELFPTAIRGAGQSFAYNFGKGSGAFCVVGVGMLSRYLPLGEAIAALSLMCYLVAILATLLLPETRGKQLSAGPLLRGEAADIAEMRQA